LDNLADLKVEAINPPSYIKKCPMIQNKSPDFAPPDFWLLGYIKSLEDN
jgi:hypothetical protein